MASKVRTEEVPLDGGWGWMVVGAAFLAHTITHGIIYSFGVLFLAVQDTFPGSKAELAWISSTCTGALYLIGPLAGILSDRYGFTMVTVLGSSLAAGGYILSVFVTNLYVLYLTMGVMAGCGIGMVFLPAIVVVTKYFHHHRAVACGLAISGCGAGGFIFSPLMEMLSREYGWRGTLLVLGGLLLNCIPCGFIFRPLPRRPLIRAHAPTEKAVPAEMSVLIQPELTKCDASNETINHMKGSEVQVSCHGISTAKGMNDSEGTLIYDAEPTECKNGEYSGYSEKGREASPSELPEIVFEMQKQDAQLKHSDDTWNIRHHFSICANSTFLIFLLSQFLFFLGFYLPFVYVPDRAVSIGLDESSGVWAVSTIGLSSIAGRVLLGKVADSPRVNRLLMFKVMLLITGISTALGPLYTSSPLLFIYAVVFGVSTGTTLSLTSVVLVDLLGMNDLNDAFGFTTFVSGIASLIGSPAAGALFDATASYDISFMLFGCIMATSGVVMFVPSCCKYLRNKT